MAMMTSSTMIKTPRTAAARRTAIRSDRPTNTRVLFGKLIKQT
jgi:hypothetical protein